MLSSTFGYSYLKCVGTLYVRILWKWFGSMLHKSHTHTVISGGKGNESKGKKNFECPPWGKKYCLIWISFQKFTNVFALCVSIRLVRAFIYTAFKWFFFFLKKNQSNYFVNWLAYWLIFHELHLSGCKLSTATVWWGLTAMTMTNVRVFHCLVRSVLQWAHLSATICFMLHTIMHSV